MTILEPTVPKIENKLLDEIRMTPDLQRLTAKLIRLGSWCAYGKDVYIRHILKEFCLNLGLVRVVGATRHQNYD